MYYLFQSQRNCVVIHRFGIKLNSSIYMSVAFATMQIYRVFSKQPYFANCYFIQKVKKFFYYILR